jgi:exopolysaccharide biosynthesis polyprenyl glycosylphosphotransferase
LSFVSLPVFRRRRGRTGGGEGTADALTSTAPADGDAIPDEPRGAEPETAAVEFERLVAAIEPPPVEPLEDGRPSQQWAANATRGLILVAALAASFLIPSIVAGDGVPQVAAAVVPCILAALFAEIVHETTSSLMPDTPASRPLPIMAAAIAGVAFQAAVAELLNLPWDGAAAPLALCAAVATLGLAWLSDDLRTRIGTGGSRVFFIGSHEQYLDLVREIERRRDLKVVEHLDLDEGHAPTTRPGNVVAKVVASGASVLVMSAEAIRDPTLVAAASELNLLGLRVRTLHDYYERQFAKVPLSELSPQWFLFDVAEIHQPRIYGGAKRLLETMAAAVLLVLCAPIMILVCVLIKLEDGGPVFFRQQRVGKHGFPFLLTKFRTMSLAPSSPSEAEWATAHPWRVTRVGAYLRRFRLDELPQLWNVVCGQLSLVGPRPEQPHIVERLTESIDFYRSRLCVRPGLTGWAQVNYGYGGSLRGNVEKLQYDFFYIKRQNLRLDLMILAATVRTVLRGGGR